MFIVADRFASLLSQMDYRPAEDFLIFLGDYIDRGPEPVRVLDWMMEHVEEGRLVALRGNHEQMLLDYGSSGGSEFSWLLNSGISPWQAVKKSFIPGWHRYLEFVRSLPCCYRLEANGKNYFFAHAGINPAKALDEQSEEDLLWIRSEYYEQYQGKTVVVSGHTPVQFVGEGQSVPISKPHMIMLDTGSFMPEGHISAMDVETREFWQSN